MKTVIFNNFRNFSELDMDITEYMEENGYSEIISHDFCEDGYKVVFGK